jgi:hypothetical protein
LATTCEATLLLDYAVMNVEAIELEDGSLQVTLDGKPLTCLVCGNQHYRERGFLLNTRSGEFFGVAWADEKASCFICTGCGYIFWFLIKEMKRSKSWDPPDRPLLDRIFRP